jgi:hypothetical protein
MIITNIFSDGVERRWFSGSDCSTDQYAGKTQTNHYPALPGLIHSALKMRVTIQNRLFSRFV